MSAAGDCPVAVIGTGLIGASWAALFLARGKQVVAYDPAPGAEQRMCEQIDEAWADLERVGLSEGADRDRLRFATSVADAVGDAVFIQESGPERLDLKRALLADIESGAGVDVVIASSSSGLRISDMQTSTRHPERIVLGHPFNPPHLIPLVEVIGGEQTSERTVEEAMEFYRDLGKQPVRICAELPGHVANRLQVAVWRESIALARAGVISVADLDTVMTSGPGLRWALLGPFGTLHAGGGRGGIRHMLEHLGPAMRDWSADLAEFPEGDDYIDEVSALVEAAFDAAQFRVALAERDDRLLRLIELREKPLVLTTATRKEHER